MGNEYVYPKYSLDGFNCPHCHAYAHQCWSDIKANGLFNKSMYFENVFQDDLTGFKAAKCSKCKKYPSGAAKRSYIQNQHLYPNQTMTYRTILKPIILRLHAF